MKIHAKDGQFCPHCGADLHEVGVITHSRCHQTANVVDDGQIQDYDDTEIEEEDSVQCRTCLNDLGIIPDPE